MSGRHAAPRTPRKTFVPLATAAVTTAVLAGGSFIAAQVSNPDAEATAASTATAGTDGPAATPSATAGTVTRAPGRVSRGSARRPSPSPIAATAKVLSSGTCGASFYDEGQSTANGETFDPDALTAAHKTLPFNTRIRVTNPKNGRSVVVRINDRGPYISGRCIDLSRAAFRTIANLSAGHTIVRYEVLKK